MTIYFDVGAIELAEGFCSFLEAEVLLRATTLDMDSSNLPKALIETISLSKKKVFITGSTGFIGKNLMEALLRENIYTILTYERGFSSEELRDAINDADYVVHLAGVSRSLDSNEFYVGNSHLKKK